MNITEFDTVVKHYKNLDRDFNANDILKIWNVNIKQSCLWIERRKNKKYRALLTGDLKHLLKSKIEQSFGKAIIDSRKYPYWILDKNNVERIIELVSEYGTKRITNNLSYIKKKKSGRIYFFTSRISLNNFETLISYRKSSNKSLNNYYKDRLGKGKVFVVELINGRIEFAPSKFIGYKNNSKSVHEKLYNTGRDGRKTDDALHNYYGRELFDENLHQLLNYFFEENGIESSPYKNKTDAKYLFDKDNYDEILRIGRSSIPFFDKRDVEKYSIYGGQPYRTENRELFNIGREIRDKLHEKTNYWAKNIHVPEFVIEEGTNWQIMGIFSSYTWARILKPQYKDYRVYFTVGLDYTYKSIGL